MESLLLYHFILTSYSLFTQVVTILILIDVQYLQNVVFSFEKGSKGQSHSSSDSQHPIKKYIKQPFPFLHHIYYIDTNILIYIVLLSVFIIIDKYIIYLQIFKSADFLQYF